MSKKKRIRAGMGPAAEAGRMTEAAAERGADDEAAVETGAGAPAAPPRKFRPEIQGLRAFAVVLVAAYHFWFGTVSGGVDVFLFVSAFLMSLSFTGKIERGTAIGWKTLSTYWVHVFKRILPLAVTTVILVLVGIRLFLPASRWLTLIHEAVSVLFYYENWWSIGHAVDYYDRAATGLSPFEHFWSLSVQGQIFLTWPLLFALGWLIVKYTKAKTRPTLLAVFGTVFVASLAFSIWFTAENQTQAYYNTFARLWEFAAGTIVAILLPMIRLPRAVRALMSWIGLVAILVCGVVLDVQGMFPGYVALWPVVAASLVIVAGDSETRWGADRILSWKPLVALGTNSYALYLIHWPLLVFFLAHENIEHAGYMSGLGLLTLSVVAAVVVTAVVETPLRKWKWSEALRWRSLLVVCACLVVGAGGVFGWRGYISWSTAQALAHAATNNPGAAVLEKGFVYKGAANPMILPTTVDRGSDWAWNTDDGGLGEGCQSGELAADGTEEMTNCHVVANDHPTKRVIAVGNSHTEQWMTALKQTAKEQNWDLEFVRKPGCFFTSVADNEGADYCQEWLPQAEDYVQKAHPDALVIQSTFSTYDGRSETVRPGTEDQVRKWTGEGIQVIGIRDNARFGEDHDPHCEDKMPATQCSYDHVTATTSDPTGTWEETIPGYGAVDMDDLVCPNGKCPAVIGNVYTYIDDNHLTATYVKTMRPMFTDRFVGALNSVQRPSAAASS